MQAGTPALPGENAACMSAMDVLARIGKQRVNSRAAAYSFHFSLFSFFQQVIANSTPQNGQRLVN